MQDYQLQCLNDSIHSLAVYETESKRKDKVIADLRKEVAAYQKNSREKDLRYYYIFVCILHSIRGS